MCWEHAAALRDNVLPAMKKSGGKLFLVGVGSGQAAREFAAELNVDAALCFGDEGGSVGDALGLAKGAKTMWNPKAVSAMMERNDQESLKALGEGYKAAADRIGIPNLAPKEIKDTLRQGGTFVFKGDELLLEHYDEKIGMYASIDDIFGAVGLN